MVLTIQKKKKKLDQNHEQFVSTEYSFAVLISCLKKDLGGESTLIIESNNIIKENNTSSCLWEILIRNDVCTLLIS